MLDISHNKLEDLTSEPGLFRLPENMTEIYLSHNNLRDLPWKNLKAASQMSLLDIAYNHFDTFAPELTQMVLKKVSVFFEGKPILPENPIEQPQHASNIMAIINSQYSSLAFPFVFIRDAAGHLLFSRNCPSDSGPVH